MPCGNVSSGGVNQGVYVFQTTYENKSPTVVNEGPYDLSVNESYCSGHCTPNFHQRVANGELIPYTGWVQTQETGSEYGSYAVTYDPPGTLNRTVHTRAPWGSYGLRTDVNPTYWYIGQRGASRYLSGADFRPYVQKAAAKIYTEGGHDTLTFLGELGKTKQMLLKTADNMLRLATKTKVTKDFLSTPGKWLEARYGWRPLVYDLQDLNGAVNTLVKPRKLRHRASSGTTENDSNITTWSGEMSSSYWTKTVTDTVTIGIRGSVAADIKPPIFRLNPFVTGWELVPYSFVVDWVWDVGSYIEAMAFLTIAQKYTAAGGLKITVDREFDWQLANFKTYFSGSWNVRASSHFEGVYRFPTTVGLRPYTNVRLDAFKVTDMLLLALQRVGLRR